ncbi:hypothetical protein SAMN05421821_115124 [Mucilaginibacter lappiensis]|uniref:Uncharacterized protein n=1 Tax=Mucilaginibacter lappiensis TaxID=354630 RepID=A0A1N7EVJ9_9SPHI|nr:hypothetical protein [Mucilaginibacter lappiensis]MBB6126464.1 hypothetical protein [Mucilaginibacter lappiensis]SIR92072.1 hypothetical protein SAMN05421821_115124 [Mucilaginibacter lappiensis]
MKFGSTPKTYGMVFVNNGCNEKEDERRKYKINCQTTAWRRFDICRDEPSYLCEERLSGAGSGLGSSKNG